MTTAPTRTLAALASLTVLAACRADDPVLALAPSLHVFAHAAWSEPVDLGPPINSACTEQAPALSEDGLTLYFTSNRPGGLGAANPQDPNGCQATTDIWVVRRACVDCHWQTPMNLGPVVNTPFGDGGPSLSTDEDLLFFNSNRPGGAGGSDIYVSRRVPADGGLVWGTPERLGPDVNTPAFEQGADYVDLGILGAHAALYFGRGPTGNFQDIYQVALTRDGEPLGASVLVEELSDPSTHEASPTVRGDGREVFFFRADETSGGDIWTSTRHSVHDPWSPPTNVGPPVNSHTLDFQPSLSRDGRTLLFASDRPGSIGRSLDIWIATRAPAVR